MIKKNLKTLIITGLIILLPIVFALINWDTIPDTIPIHFNVSGEVDQYGNKSFLIIAPVIIFLLQWVGVVDAHFKNKKSPLKQPYVKVLSWVCASVSFAMSIMMYNAAIGKLMTVHRTLPIVIGLLFVIMGNLMPKFQKNKFVGLRVKWTLADSGIWFKTHRLMSRVAVVSGFAIMILGAFENAAITFPIMFGLIIVTVLIPTVYSYILYKRLVKLDESKEKQNNV